MTIKLNALLLTLGALLFGVGLILGLAPMSQSGANCGSAFSPSNDAVVSDYADALSGFGVHDAAGQCRDALSGRRGISLALVIPGVLLALGGGVVTASGKSEKANLTA
jgi:hypothetical protein